MSRDDRFREIGKHAAPDYRLLPPKVREAIERLPRNERRLRKRLVNESLQVAYRFMHADAESGAGYPIDKLLRELLLEYNDRQIGHGLATCRRPSTCSRAS